MLEKKVFFAFLSTITDIKFKKQEIKKCILIHNYESDFIIIPLFDIL